MQGCWYCRNVCVYSCVRVCVELFCLPSHAAHGAYYPPPHGHGEQALCMQSCKYISMCVCSLAAWATCQGGNSMAGTQGLIWNQQRDVSPCAVCASWTKCHPGWPIRHIGISKHTCHVRLMPKACVCFASGLIVAAMQRWRWLLKPNTHFAAWHACSPCACDGAWRPLPSIHDARQDEEAQG